MAFIVTGLSRMGPLQIDCDTPSEALEKAAELVRDGYADVLIADEAGLQYTPVEFGRLFHSRGQDFSPSGTFLKTPQPTRLEERNMTRLTLAAAIVALTATTAAAAPCKVGTTTSANGPTTKDTSSNVEGGSAAKVSPGAKSESPGTVGAMNHAGAGTMADKGEKKAPEGKPVKPGDDC